MEAKARLIVHRVALLSLLPALVACGNATPSGPPPHASLAHFSAPNYGLSFDYPASWKQASFADGVLVYWMDRTFILPPGMTEYGNTKGQPITVDGHPAKIDVGKAVGVCTAEGDEVMDVAIFLTKTSQQWTTMSACLRGPDLPELEAQVRSMLTSTVLTAARDGA